MKIAFNPSTVAALTSPPDNKDITFDLAGRNIFVRGVKFFGTDTQVNIIDNLNSSDSKSALSANMGRYLNLTKTPYNNTSAPSSAPSAYNIEICPTSSGWYSSLSIPDGGGGLLIRGNTGTAFNLWLHDTSNVWYKQTAGGAWKKMDAGYADHAGYLDNTFTVFGVEYNGSQAKSVTPSNFVSQLREGTSTVTDGTMLITSYASNNGFADSNAVNIPYKRKAIHLWEYIANKADVRYTRYYNNHDLNIDSFTDQNYIQTAASQGGGWTGTFPSGSHNGKAVLNAHTHTGNYYSQLMLDTAQNRLWMRSANNTTTYGSWFKIAYVSDIPTKNSWNYDDRYLQLTGGTMAGTAYITWADSNSWSTGTGAQGARGGLKWSGQSDYAWLYAEETAGDNLDLVIKFGDDNSNGLSIRNASNVQTTYISANGIISTGTFKGNLDWSYITSKPSFYTKAESDAKYVTSLGTSGRNLTWTKNGTTNNITVPFATYSSALKSTGDDGNWYNWVYWNGSYFWLKAGTSIYNNSTATLKTAVDYSTMSSYLVDNGTHSEIASGTTANASNAGMLYGSGMYMTRTYADSNMPTSYGNVINVAGGGSGQLLLGWSGNDSTTANIYYRSHRDTASGGWGSWATLLATNNYASILDSRYYTESEVNNLLSKKLDRVNLTTGSWNPRGYNLAADYHYNGGDISFAESGGQMHISIDGKFWQNEGQYRVLDTSDLSGIYNNQALNQYLSNSDTAWYPIVWGGSTHRNTNNSTGQLYKSHDKLSWQTSSQTLYTTKLRTDRLDVNGAPSSTSYRVADIAEFRSNYSSGIGWSVALKNTYNTSSSTGFGVGLKLALGADSETFKWVGIAAVSTSAWGNAQDMLFYTSTTEKMRLTSGGYVGIGESNPLHKLHINGTLQITAPSSGNYTEGIRINQDDSKWVAIVLGTTGSTGIRANAWGIFRKSDNNFAISRNSSDGANGLVMTSTGMGLGTTAPGYRLDVRGSARITSQLFLPINGNYQAILMGDDCWLGDCNIGNVIGLSGTTNANAGGIKFGKGGMYIGYNGSAHYASSTSVWSSFNADLLDGYHANSSQSPYNSIPVIKSDGVIELGRYIDFHYNNTGTYDYSTRLQCNGNYSNTINLPSSSGTLALTSDLPMKYYAQYHMNPDGTIYSKHGNTDFISSSSKSSTGHFYIKLKSSVASYNTFIWGSGYCVSTVSSASGTNTNTSLSVTIARTYDYGFYVTTAQGSTKVDAHYYLYFLYFS